MCLEGHYLKLLLRDIIHSVTTFKKTNDLPEQMKRLAINAVKSNRFRMEAHSHNCNVPRKP